MRFGSRREAGEFMHRTLPPCLIDRSANGGGMQVQQSDMFYISILIAMQYSLKFFAARYL
jgi:hypothetical protein